MAEEKRALLDNQYGFRIVRSVDAGNHVIALVSDAIADGGVAIVTLDVENAFNLADCGIIRKA